MDRKNGEIMTILWFIDGKDGDTKLQIHIFNIDHEDSFCLETSFPILYLELSSQLTLIRPDVTVGHPQDIPMLIANGGKIPKESGSRSSHNSYLNSRGIDL